MRTLVFSVFLIGSLLLISYSKAADIQGTFYLVPQKSDKVSQIEDSVLSRMNCLIRPLARNKLDKAARVRDKLSIALSGNRICVIAGDYALPTAPTDGTLVRYRNPEGNIVDLQTSLVGYKLEQTFSTDKGVRTNTCELSNDGMTLTMHVVIKSDYLGEPMAYTLVYRKAPSPSKG
jgi:hypothetical protein